MAFDESHVPALEARKERQRKDERAPPFDQSEEWAQCFEKIIEAIKRDGHAVVEVNW